MFSREMNIADFDPELANAMANEVERQDSRAKLPRQPWCLSTEAYIWGW